MSSIRRRPPVDPRVRRRRAAAFAAALVVGVGGAWIATSPLRAGRTARPPVASSPVRIAAADDPAPRPVFLALVLARADLSAVPRLVTAPAPTAAPPTPDIAPTPEPTAPAGPPACRVPLAARIVARQVDTGGRTVEPPAPRGFDANRPIIAAPIGGNRSLIAWSDGEGNVRVTRLAGLGRRDGEDIVWRGDVVGGLVAHADGSGAILVAHGEVMTLAAFHADGAIAWSRDLVGRDGKGAGAKWIDDWGHESRLAWTGRVYSAYFGHTQNWGADGRHQGDLLWHFDRDGAPVDGESAAQPAWSWGCSHSLDVRLPFNADVERIGPVCLSDCYPGKGIYLTKSVLISAEPSGDCNGGSDARLGGAVPLGDGFMISYASKEGRGGRRDAAMARAYADGEVGPPWWLTDTPGVDETGVHLAPYGDHLFATWRADGAILAAVVTPRGAFVEGPVAIAAEIGDRDDLASWPNGDVGWAYRGPQNALYQAILPLCAP